MQARQGRVRVAPAPPHMLVLTQVEQGNSGPLRRCPLSGEIGTPGALCDIVGFIGHSGWRGELIVMGEGATRSVYFNEGQIIGGHSTVESERVGQILFRYGVLSPEQIAASSDAAAAGSIRFGEAAVKLGFVTREKLFAMTSRQTEEIFYGMLLTSSGMFYFLDAYDENALSSRQKLTVASLIREGVRRMHETRYFRARIPSDQHIPQVESGRAPPEADPLGLFGVIDGARSVAEIGRKLGRSEFEVLRGVFQLIQSGHVVMRPPRLSRQAIVGVYNQAIALLLRELDAMDEGDAAREQLAEFASQGEGYRTLLAGAGPQDDGTLYADQVAKNVDRLSPSEAAEETLAKMMHDYASYALFLARPHLHRAQEAREKADRQAGFKPITQRVAAMLEPIAPPVSPGSARLPTK